MAKRDVQMLVRVRDEGSRAVATFTDAVAALIEQQNALPGSAAGASSSLEQLAAIALKIDKAFASTSGAVDKGVASYEAQASAIAATVSKLAAAQAKADGIRNGLALLKKEADAAFVGPRRDGLSVTIKAVGKELKSTEDQVKTLSSTLDSQHNEFRRFASPLQQLASTERALGNVAADVAAKIDIGTRALREREAVVAAVAARENSLLNLNRNAGAAQSFFNAKFAPGLVRQDAVAGGASFDALAAKMAEVEARAASIRAKLDPVAEVQARMAAETLRAKEAFDSGALSMEHFTAEQARIQAEGQQTISTLNGEAAAAEAVGRAAREAGLAEEEMARKAAALKATIDPLGTIQDRLNRELAEAARLYKSGAISAQELALAEKVLARNAQDATDALNRQGKGERGKIGLFGLKPYELTNAGYQINDILTQLASGTSLTQTLAQQGGQLLQLFPKLGSSIVAALGNPMVLAGAVAFGGIALGIKRIADEEGRLRSFGGTLAAMGDDAGHSAEALSDASVELDRFGLSAEQAVGIVRTFLKEGIDPSRIEEFGRAAKNMADILGVDVKDAAGQVAKAFVGGYDALAKFDDAQQFLTASEREHIRVMFESGRASEARAEAFRLFSERMEEGADKARGPWSEAARSLGVAWDGVLKTFANVGVVRALADALDRLADRAANALDKINGVRTAATVLREIQVVEREAEMIRGSNAGFDPFGLKASRLAELSRELVRLDSELKALQRTAAGEDPRNENAAAVEKARNDALETLRREREALYAVTDAQKIRVAGEQAFHAERMKSGDLVIANAKRQFAIEKETLRIRREHAKEAEQERKRRESQFAADIAKARRARLNDTASGFIGRNENVAGDREVLKSLFKQAGISVDPKMVAWCAAFVNAVLATNGLPGTGSLAARSFLNYGKETSSPEKGDIVVLKRGGNSAQGHVGFFDSFDARGNVRVTGGNQKDGVNTQTFSKKDVLSFRRAPDIADVYAEAAKEQEKRAEQQADFNAAIDAENVKRGETIVALRSQQGLVGEALIDAQKQQFVDEAVAAQRAKSAKNQLNYTREQEASTRVLAALEFEMTRGAKERAEIARKAAEKPVEDLSDQRSALMEQIEFYKSIGQDGIAEKLKEQLDGINSQLSAAITTAIRFWMSVGGAEAAAAILKLQNLQNSLIVTQNEFIFTSRQIQEAFAGSLTNAATRFAEAIGQGGNALRATRDLFLGFASDFLGQIAQMLLQAAALKLAMKIGFGKVAGGMTSLFNAAPLAAAGAVLSGAGNKITTGGAAVGLGALALKNASADLMKAAGLLLAANAAGSSGIFHGGGIAGFASRSRSVHPAIFANAMRFHGGGIAGLRGNEVPAILERGEEILTRDNPRHILNGGEDGAAVIEPKVDLMINNLLDAGDVVSKGLSTRPGQRAFLNFIRANASAVRAATGA